MDTLVFDPDRDLDPAPRAVGGSHPALPPDTSAPVKPILIVILVIIGSIMIAAHAVFRRGEREGWPRV